MRKFGPEKDKLEDYITDVDTDLTNIVKAINAGFKPKRMTTAQRNALTNVFPGLIIWNVSTATLDVYNGTAWKTITMS